MVQVKSKAGGARVLRWPGPGDQMQELRILPGPNEVDEGALRAAVEASKSSKVLAGLLADMSFKLADHEAAPAPEPKKAKEARKDA